MFQELLVALAQALEAKQIPYMLIGGQAVLLYGEPRLTRDVDVTLGVNVDRLKDVLEMVYALGWKVLVEDVHKFVRKTLILPCQTDAGIRVDLIFSFSSYERQAIQRARRVTLGNTQVAFASVEDLIIHKMVAGRPRDLEDVVSILRKNPALNREYLKEWLKHFEEALGKPLWEPFCQMLEQS